MLGLKLHCGTFKPRKSSWTGTGSFVLKVPLWKLRPSIINSLPCDRIVQRAYYYKNRIYLVPCRPKRFGIFERFNCTDVHVGIESLNNLHNTKMIFS